MIGDLDESEYTVTPIKDAIALLKTENNRAEVHQVEESDHVFSGKEAEVIALIANFMQRNILVEHGKSAFPKFEP
jgi:alpha/beta superfamily hydrolase